MQRGYRLTIPWKGKQGQFIHANSALASRIEIITENHDYYLISLDNIKDYKSKIVTMETLKDYKNIYITDNDSLFDMCISNDLEMRNLAAKLIENGQNLNSKGNILE